MRFFGRVGFFTPLQKGLEQLLGLLEQLNASRASLDCEMMLADGYAGKVLSPKPIKGVITRAALEPVLKALRLKLIVVDDPEEAARRGEIPQRDRSQVRMNNDARRNKGRRKPKPKSARVKKPAPPKRGKPYLSR